MVLDKRVIITYYEETPSYAQVARRLGVTRQRIEQIISGLHKDELTGIINHRRQPVTTILCTMCYQRFSKRGALIGDICSRCLSWTRKGEKDSARRKHVRPLACLVCHIVFTKDFPNGGRGLCLKDYRHDMYTRYTQSEEYRMKKRLYSRKSARLHKETILSYQRRYYKTHREAVLKRTRLWQMKNRDKLREYQRRLYWKKKLTIEFAS